MRQVVEILVALLLAAGWSLPAGAQTVRHSGTILAVDRGAGTMVLGEIGPWRVVRGATQVTRLTISVTPSTVFSQVGRDATRPFPGDFVEAATGAGDLKVGDVVTVECQHKGKRLTALKVTVARLNGS